MTSLDAVPAIPRAGCFALVAAPVGRGKDDAVTAKGLVSFVSMEARCPPDSRARAEVFKSVPALAVTVPVTTGVPALVVFEAIVLRAVI
jgi:hypothetical protein